MDYALILGSNRQRARHLRLAARRIAETFEVRACAPARRTRDPGGMRYLNAGVVVRSDLNEEALRALLRAIEDEAGRERGGATCTLDIDLVAGVDGTGAPRMFKPDDLRRDYVRELLGELGLRRVIDAP